MRLAAAGLALRGHQVWWKVDASRDTSPASWFAPAPIPSEIVPITRTAGLRVDAVIGGDPFMAALDGWHGGAHAMALSLTPEAVRRWNPVRHWCWESLDSSGLVESDSETESLAGLEPERVVRWPAAPPATEPDAAHADTETLERTCERLLARRRGRATRPAVFLDRDGTLVVEHGYLSDPERIELLPGVPQALRTLQGAGFSLVVISNQSGVARGYYPLAAAYATMAALRRALRAHGVELDAIHFCPHHPDAGCECRKPGIALLERAGADLRLDLRHSFVVGDKLIDIETARAARAHGVLVRTGYGEEEECRLGAAPNDARPDRVCDDLGRATEWILERRADSPMQF
jgi:D,D-heptose 1,7-bisphosphate phosphatase